MSNKEDSPGKHHTLIFDVQKTIAGNGYNPFSGLFTAPSDGLYVFSCSNVMVHSYASFNVVKNAEIQGTLFVDASAENEWRYSSITLVLNLTKGDVMFVRTSTTYQPHGSI